MLRSSLLLLSATSIAIPVAAQTPASKPVQPAAPQQTPAPAAAAAAAAAAPAKLSWLPMTPDTIGRLVVRVDTAGKRTVRLSIDTAGGTSPITTGPISADSVEAWAAASEKAATEVGPTTSPADHRLGEFVLITRDSTPTGRAYRLLVADSTGDRTFAVMVPPSHVGKITSAFARATRPVQAPPPLRDLGTPGLTPLPPGMTPLPKKQ